MPGMKVLICGGGCAGPALALWLSRNGHRITVCERYPALRAGGAQVDLRAQGIEVMRRMGLLDNIRSKRMEEEGTAFIDAQGKVKATLLANKSGKGSQSLTSEYEIMRGDLVRILYDATRDKVEYIFGKTVERFDQVKERVVVYFSDGKIDTYDLLVGADGQGSRIRRAILPSDSPDPAVRRGTHLAYWFIPRTEEDSNMASMYHSPGGRCIIRRSHTLTETQVYFMLKDDSEDMRTVHKASKEAQKEYWTQRFSDAGGQTERFLKGMKSADNWYCHEVALIRTDTWHKGRVVLLGDAAQCTIADMGTTGCFVGAYILAGEISRNPANIPEALSNYEKTLRPFANEFQKTSPWLMRLFLPDMSWGIAVLHFFLGLVCLLHIPDLFARFSSADHRGWTLPNYPGLEQRN